MGKRIGMEVAIAAVEAVALCNIDVAAVYPITPQSHIAEHMADVIHDGRIDSEFITVESEHSAISACAGASAAGARAYTATSSQGLMLMHEILPIVSAMRLPICMANANRAVSGPLNIWNDHTDIMPQRDSGWISLFTENGQEAIDLSIMSFKIAEDPEVMLPCVVNIDGFQLTHMIEPLELPSKAEVAKFLPPRKPFASLHPDNPISMGCFAMPDTYTETVMAKEAALVNSKKVITRVFSEWAKRFGRKYSVVETYKSKGADTLMLTMGSMGETASTAVDEMRKAGPEGGPREASPLEALPGRGAEGRHPGVQDAHRHGPCAFYRGRRRPRGHGRQIDPLRRKEKAPGLERHCGPRRARPDRQ